MRQSIIKTNLIAAFFYWLRQLLSQVAQIVVETPPIFKLRLTP